MFFITFKYRPHLRAPTSHFMYLLFYKIRGREVNGKENRYPGKSQRVEKVGLSRLWGNYCTRVLSSVTQSTLNLLLNILQRGLC